MGINHGSVKNGRTSHNRVQAQPPILPPIFHYIYLGEEKEYPAKKLEKRDNRINQWSWDTLPINKFW